ncbi:WD40-repeat-containing domain protein [Melampsora americana]|nr:WD40-repeat-containing domain protein [Melampsora americana]
MEGFDLPFEFGKKVKQNDISSKISKTKRVSTSNSNEKTIEINSKVENQVEQDEVDDEDEVDEKDELPISHEVELKDHSKTISSISLDPSGARIISGSYDYNCKLWDFGGMNSNFKPFRTWEPRESHQVHQTLWSNTGDSFLVVTASNQPQLYDRDGSQIAEYIKGDMYIRDMRHCAGHIAELTSCAWHPKDNKTFITSAADSTIRIWDVENKRKSKSVIVLKSKERGTRTKITACAYSPDGKTIAAAGMDGTLNLWATSSNFSRPNSTVENAHEKNSETSCLQFSNDCKTIVSRGGDHTVKLWDVRAMKKPLAVKNGLNSMNPENNLIFSPDQKYILTGISAEVDKNLGGRVVVLDKTTLEIHKTIAISKANVVRVLWHPKINQILTGSSDGTIHVLYSPHLSTRGATLSLSRTARVRGPGEEDVDLERPIITPHALAMYKTDEPIVAGGRGGKRKRERERQDPVKTLKPMPPLTGPGKGGRVGASATQHVVQGLVKDSIRHEDPREALLKFAAEHEGEASKFTGAWESTMPKPIFDERLLEEEAKEEKEKEEAEEERKRLKRERPTRLI